MPKSAPSTLYMLHFIAHRLNFTIMWNVAQRTADGLYSNVWISDAFHELIRSVGCFPTGLAEHKAWKIESRDCFCSHFSWAPECHPYHHRKKKHQTGQRFVMSSYPAAVDHAAAQQRPSGDREAQEHCKRHVVLTSPPPSSNCSKSWSNCLCQRALLLKSKLSGSSLFQFNQGRRMTVAPKYTLVVQDDLSKQNQPASVICLWGMTWVIIHTKSAWKDWVGFFCCCFQ